MFKYSQKYTNIRIMRGIDEIMVQRTAHVLINFGMIWSKNRVVARHQKTIKSFQIHFIAAFVTEFIVKIIITFFFQIELYKNKIVSIKQHLFIVNVVIYIPFVYLQGNL